MNKIAQFNCKSCQKKTFVTLKNEEQRKEVVASKKLLNCHSCSFKYWDKRIKNGEIVLELESPEFQRLYWEEKKNFDNYVRI